MLDEREAMIYNLALRVVRYYIMELKKEIKKDKNEGFIDKSTLEGTLNFRKKHIAVLDEKNEFFDKKGDNYYFRDKLVELYITLLEKYNENKETNVVDYYKGMFVALKDIVFNQRNSENFREQAKKMIELVKKLHWKYLPIFSEQMIVNRGCSAEENLEEFYFHYHPLEDLYEWIEEEKKEIIQNKLGDINLDQNIEVKVYSQRWKHIDTYVIRRTLEGWEVDFLMVGGSGSKEGEAITKCLEHDSISFPENIKYDFSSLWNEADNSNMTLEELKMKLEKIFNWINVIEVSKPNLDDDKGDYLDRFYEIANTLIGDK